MYDMTGNTTSLMLAIYLHLKTHGSELGPALGKEEGIDDGFWLMKIHGKMGE